MILHPHTARRIFSGTSILDVRVSTTSYSGGDGSKTEVRFSDLGGFPFDGCDNNTGQVSIRCSGDGEIDILIQALQFAAESLRALTRTGGPR